MRALAVILTMLLLSPTRGVSQQAGPVLIPELTDEDLARATTENGGCFMVEDKTLQKALAQLKERVAATHSVVRFTLFGSAARGEMDEESDVDVLILTEKPLTWKERDAISDETFLINLRYGTNISVLIVDLHNWESGPVSVMPIREEIRREGIEL